MKQALFSQTVAFLILLGACCGFGYAQTEGIEKLKIPKNPDASNKKNKDYQRVKSAVDARATARTGSLTVVAPAGAKIFLEPAGKQKRGRNLQGQVDPGRQSFIFNGLEPGTYQVSAELTDHIDAEAKAGNRMVTIISGTPEVLEFKLRHITFNVTIKTNIKTGTVMYAAGNGGKMFREEIQNGIATLPDLRPGTYQIEINPTEFGYLQLKDKIEVSEGQTVFEKKLEYRLSEGTLAPNWTSLDNWDVPPGWSASTRKLLVNGQGVALPRNENFRHYADFSLVSDVKMMNDVAVSLVLRAVDKQNYYLIQITGGKSDEPYVLRGFVVKNGVSRRLQDSINVSGYAGSLTGRPFELTIQGVKNKFTVSISDSQTGDQATLGVLTDFDSHFRIGAPGIAAQAQEQNEIARFIVTPASNNPR